MRLEKINENQIRCTLDKEDLSSRGLRLSELAYGTEKARELFRDMMQQASYEFGFDAEDLPLMIEAIPASLDRLVLVITKLEDPDELDTRFSKFSPDPSMEDEYPDSTEDEDDDFWSCLNQSDPYMTTADPTHGGQPSESERENDSSFIPLPDCLGLSTSSSSVPDKEKKRKTTPDMMKVFVFASLSDISEAARRMTLYHGENHVYKNPSNGLYYLVLFRSDHTTEDFGRTCNLLSEYSRPERVSYATFAYMEEHFECIIRNKAVEILSDL